MGLFHWEWDFYDHTLLASWYLLAPRGIKKLEGAKGSDHKNLVKFNKYHIKMVNVQSSSQHQEEPTRGEWLIKQILDQKRRVGSLDGSHK